MIMKKIKSKHSSTDVDAAGRHDSSPIWVVEEPDCVSLLLTLLVQIEQVPSDLLNVLGKEKRTPRETKL